MRLRTRIFRRLVIIALIPTIIIALAAFYFLSKAIEQSSAWLSVSSPDRTINSLRLTETRLQEAAQAYLTDLDIDKIHASDSLFDWWVIIANGEITETYNRSAFKSDVDSLLRTAKYEPEFIRQVIGDYLIVGAAVNHPNGIVAGGFILDREYLSGFDAASSALRENRRFQNLMPGFILFLGVAGATILVFIIIGAYFLSRRLSASVTTPLEHLTAVTAAVARGGAPAAISITGTEEISRLAETFNRMIVDLEESRRRLAAAERVAAWQEFARRMAHELKNPLTPISLSLYRIKKSLQENGLYDRFAESIEAIAAEVAHLERLASDYSSLSKLPGPKMKSFELTALVREVINLHAAQLENYAFTEELPVEAVTIEADPDHLRQVMVNLIKNAIEFTAPGKKIDIRVTVDRQNAAFAVANEGGDINEADLRSAKMPYFSTRQGGSGLGLAVSEKIIIDHGGSLTIGLENGLTVARFNIPRRRIGATGRAENT